MPFIPLASGSRSFSDFDETAGSPERMVNWFPHPADNWGGMHALRRYGLSLHNETIPGPVRAITSNGVSAYCAAGGKLWQIAPSVVELGSIVDGETFMAASFGEVAVVVNGGYYIWDGSALTSHTTGAILTPAGVCYQDGYFIVWGSGSGRSDLFQVSTLNDGKTFSAGDVLTAESQADTIRCIIPTSTGLAIFGAATVEFWYNAGAATGVYRRNGSAGFDIGCRGAKLACAVDSAVYWVGDDYQIYRLAGFGYERVSDRLVAHQSADLTRCFTVRNRDNRFVCFHREYQPTLVYNQDTGAWSEFSTDDGPWVARCAVEHLNNQFYGTDDGISVDGVGEFTDNGALIPLDLTTPVFDFGGQRRSLPILRFKFGAITTDISREPSMMLKLSRDGATWTDWKERGLGAIGEYNRQVTFRNLGQCRQIQARVRVTDPVRGDLYGVSYE